MKAITISQPWASRIASGEKWVENRTWRTSYRGPLAIHAGKGTQYLLRREMSMYPVGCVVATAELVACVFLGSFADGSSVPLRDVEELNGVGITLDELLDHQYTEGPYCLVLKDIEKLDKPIPARGAQGLWNWNG